MSELNETKATHFPKEVSGSWLGVRDAFRNIDIYDIVSL